ncbi:hypothetical protein [Hymenobacter fastidiosus]|uniref:hypothetical protein n=1 Tax=Hymenobacter fastidiosus TaxID=486264 RepID=UPI0031EE0A70
MATLKKPVPRHRPRRRTEHEKPARQPRPGAGGRADGPKDSQRLRVVVNGKSSHPKVRVQP